MLSKRTICEIWDLAVDINNDNQLVKNFYIAEYDKIHKYAPTYRDDEICIGSNIDRTFYTVMLHILRAMINEPGTTLAESFSEFAKKSMDKAHPGWRKSVESMSGILNNVAMKGIRSLTPDSETTARNYKTIKNFNDNDYYAFKIDAHLKNIAEGITDKNTFDGDDSLWTTIFMDGIPFTIKASLFRMLCLQFRFDDELSKFKELPSTNKLKETMKIMILQAYDDEEHANGAILKLGKTKTLGNIILNRLATENSLSTEFQKPESAYENFYTPRAMTIAWSAIGADVLDGLDDLSDCIPVATRSADDYMEAKLFELYFRKFNYADYRKAASEDRTQLPMSITRCDFEPETMLAPKNNRSEDDPRKNPYCITSLLKKEDPHRMLSECMATVMLGALKDYANKIPLIEIKKIMENDDAKSSDSRIKNLKKSHEDELKKANDEIENLKKERELSRNQNKRLEQQIESIRSSKKALEKDYLSQLSDKNKEIAELKEQLQKLQNYIVAAEHAENNPADDEPSVSEEEPKDENLDDIFQKRLIFVCGEDSMLYKIKAAFPNAKLYNESRIYSDNASAIDAVVVLTNNTGHPEYYDAKNKCRNLNIPFINAPSTNFNRIAAEIKRGLEEYANRQSDDEKR